MILLKDIQKMIEKINEKASDEDIKQELEEAYNVLKDEIKTLEKLLEEEYDYITSDLWDLPKILKGEVHENDVEKIEKYNRTVLDDIQDNFAIIKNHYMDFFGWSSLFESDVLDNAEFLNDAFDLNENHATINVHLKTKYQGIKSIVHFEDYTEIVDYAHENTSDPYRLEELEEIIEDNKKKDDCKTCVDILLNFVFTPDNDYEIIWNE